MLSCLLIVPPIGMYDLTSSNQLRTTSSAQGTAGQSAFEPALRASSGLTFINDEELYAANNFLNFEDLWNLPAEYVEELNYRRGGWSGASKLTLKDGSATTDYFVKRQENQFRYSFSRPFGALTFQYEVDAILRNQQLDLPAIDLVCWGVRSSEKSTQGLLVTRATDYSSVSDILATKPDWARLGPVLSIVGEKLLQMHENGIQHGALYPKHIYINLTTGDLKLIDLERARKCLFPKKAIKSDLSQLIKCLPEMPNSALSALMRPYQQKYASLLQQLLSSLR